MPKGKALSEAERDQIRRQIFETVTPLFIKQGFQRTTMREIARAVGLGKSTLYDYFVSKEHILLYFIEQEINLVNQTAEMIAKQQLTAPEKLRRVLESQWAYLAGNREIAALMARSAQALSPPAEIQFNALRMEYRKILQTIIQQGIEEGTFRTVDSSLAATALHNMLIYTFYGWILIGKVNRMHDAVDSLVDLYLTGIAA